MDGKRRESIGMKDGEARKVGWKEGMDVEKWEKV